MNMSTAKPQSQSQWPLSAELNHVQELEVALEREFPAAAEAVGDGLSRRRWLQLMGASMALGGMIGCRDKVETIAPFAFRPNNRIPGIPQSFATTVDVGGFGQPLLATCNDGRPTKLDGNPDHVSGKGTDAFTQAMILDLYDPDRSRTVRHRSGDSYVDSSYSGFRKSFADLDLKKLFVLAEPSSSPTLGRLKQRLTDAGASWFEYTPVSQDAQRAGARQALGKAYRQHCHFEKAKVVVTLDADPLGLSPDGIANSVGFAHGRDPDKGWMSRLYSVESTYTNTGATADHRIAMRSGLIGSFLTSLETAVDQAIANDGKVKRVKRETKESWRRWPRIWLPTKVRVW